MVVRDPRVIEREGKRERAVRMQAIAERIMRAGKKIEIARGEGVGEWLQRSRPARRIGCIVQLGGELQQPRPAIGPLERAAVRAREISHFRGNRVGREMAVEERVDRESAGQIGKAAAQPHEQPVHVHARMPVVAAVEGRMKSPRRERIGVGRHDVIELVRILAVDVRERQFREARDVGKSSVGRDPLAVPKVGSDTHFATGLSQSMQRAREMRI